MWQESRGPLRQLSQGPGGCRTAVTAAGGRGGEEEEGAALHSSLSPPRRLLFVQPCQSRRRKVMDSSSQRLLSQNEEEVDPGLAASTQQGCWSGVPRERQEAVGLGIQGRRSLVLSESWVPSAEERAVFGSRGCIRV